MHDGNRVFISYSHRGNGPEWKSALLRALDVFERHHLLDVWQDGKIRVSSYWDDDIKDAMTSAQLAIVLLTKEALESEYILGEEFPALKELQQEDDLPVIPVICEPCDWRGHDWLRATQAPNKSNPLAELSADEQARVFRELATEVGVKLSETLRESIPEAESPLPDSRVFLDRFPLETAHGLRENRLIGREQELALLDLAFAQPHSAIASLVAWGGVGKSMLVQQWLRRLQHENWAGIERIYAWSFYSEGTSEDRQASEDSFLFHALDWFGVECEPTTSAWDKGRLLAEAVSRCPTLLVLDGIEPLQYPPGPMGGQLRAPGVQALLKHLARMPAKENDRGLCLVTTREPLTDLTDFERRRHAAWGSVLRLNLDNLTQEAGAALLHHAGANKVGSVEIEPNDAELINASREVDGHALTLNLLGRFLARAHNGDVRRRDLVQFEQADRDAQGGTTFKMLAGFESWFANSGEFGERQLAILRMLGLFDRPANSGCLGTLREPPVISELTDPLFTIRMDAETNQPTFRPIIEEDWNTAVSFLEEFGLVTRSPWVQTPIRGFTRPVALLLKVYGPNAGEEIVFEPLHGRDPIDSFVLDAHPLVREYFRDAVSGNHPQSAISAHGRIFEYLKDNTPYWPIEIQGLESLYQAVFHGCLAGHHEEARKEVLDERIKRGTSGHNANYSIAFLGAPGADLTALASFFDQPWVRISPALSDTAKAWVFNDAGYCLRFSGRLEESLEPFRAAAALSEGRQDWTNAALDTSNLCQSQLALGRLAEAQVSGEAALSLAEKSGHAIWPIHMKARLASVHHGRGDKTCAFRLYGDAEVAQETVQPDFPILYSVSGFDCCKCWLDDAEPIVARTTLLDLPIESARVERALTSCQVVEKRARVNLKWLEGKGLQWLEIAMGFMARAQAQFYEAALERLAGDQREEFESALNVIGKDMDSAITFFRRANIPEFLPPSLVTYSWIQRLSGEHRSAAAGLDEASDIAKRGPMRLHMADVHLYRARLFHSVNPYPWNEFSDGTSRGPKDDLAAARAIIEDCGYWRRKEELEDAERASEGW